MKKLSYEILNAEERQYVDKELKKFTNYNSDEHSYKGYMQVREICRDATVNNRLASVVLLLEIYKLEKPDNYFKETGWEVHDSLILIAKNPNNEFGEEIYTWMVDYLFQQNPNMIGDLVFVSHRMKEGMKERLLDIFFQGLESSDDKTRKKAERAKEERPIDLKR